MTTNVFYAGQNDYVQQLNNLWDRATTSLIGTSTNSLTLSEGSKTFTTNTNLQFAAGSQVTITATGDLSKYMSGQVISYNQETGAITVNVTSVNGSGTFTSWNITVSGAAGATGAAGIADTLSIGSVTSGVTASATITGTSPDKYLNLVLQKGDTGVAGAPNILSIGSVTSGVTADATITGTSPTQTLNLVLPKGDTGNTGATGAKGLNAKGAWTGATPYVVDDWVTYSGSSYYRVIAGTTGTDPATDTTNWSILAQKGADGTGAVTDVTASFPLASSGGATPNITIQVANTSQGGYLTNTDWNIFNNKQATSEKDENNGYVGLTLFKINFKNVANTVTSHFTNTNTVARTYTFQDRDGTIVDNTDLALKADLVSPSFTTPTLGVASATSINKVVLTTPATGSTITVVDGKTFTSSNTLTLAGTDGSTLNVGVGGTLGSAAYTDSTAYAPASGSASITTVGTINSGTWNGSVVAGQYGGTGVNNTGKTLTLGGNHSNSGAFASTFTFTGTTSVTFPTSGILLSTAALVTVAQGGTGLSTIPSGSLLVGAGTSNPTAVSPSTAGNVLTSDGSSWVSSSPPSSGGHLVLVAETKFTASALTQLTNCFTSTYDNYHIVISIPSLSASSNTIYMRMLGTSSATITSGYYYINKFNSATSTTFDSTGSTGASPDIWFSLGAGGGIVTSANYMMIVDVVAAQSSSDRSVRWQGAYSNIGFPRAGDGGGVCVYGSPFTGFSVFPSTGTMAGSIQVYGYKKVP